MENKDVGQVEIETCAWEEDECSCFTARCNGKGFIFNDGGADSNGFRFCPYCGKPIIETRYCEEDEDDA